MRDQEEMIGELTKEEHDFMFSPTLTEEDLLELTSDLLDELDYEESLEDDYDVDLDDMKLWDGE